MSRIARGGRLLLGMDLGVSSIKLVEARKTDMGFGIARWTEVPMPPGAYSDGQILSPRDVGKALKEVLKTQFRPGTRQVAVAVGGQSALVRRLALPKMKLPRLREMLETQGDQWIPFLREGAVFDLAVADPDLSDHEQEVLLVAVPSRYVDGVAAALKVAGLRLAALDVDAAAHYRAALAARTAPRDGTVAILDMDQERARVGLFHEGNLAVVRTLDAIPYVPEPGAPPPDPLMFEGLVVDVRRSLETMLSQVRGATSLSALVVASSRLPAKSMLDLLERELLGEMPHRLTADFQVRPAASADVPAGTTLAFGLALMEASPPRSLDLMPRPTTAQRRHRRISTILTAALLLGAGTYGLLWSTEMPELQQRHARQEQLLNQLNTYLATEPEIAAEEALAQKLRPVIQQLNRNDPWFVALPHLKELLPSGVAITITGEPPNLRLAGEAPSFESLAELLQELEDSPYFGSPVLVDFARQDSAGVGFSLTVQMAAREVAEQ